MVHVQILLVTALDTTIVISNWDRLSCRLWNIALIGWPVLVLETSPFTMFSFHLIDGFGCLFEEGYYLIYFLSVTFIIHNQIDLCDCLYYVSRQIFTLVYSFLWKATDFMGEIERFPFPLMPRRCPTRRLAIVVRPILRRPNYVEPEFGASHLLNGSVTW